MSQPHSHRPTGLKQRNKSFKSRHATKSSLKTQAKGRVESFASSSSAAGSVGRRASKAAAEAQKKQNRLNTAHQLRDAKRKELAVNLKFFSTSSGGSAAPRITSVVPLHPEIKNADFAYSLVKVLGLDEHETEKLVEASGLGKNEIGSFVVHSPKYKTTLQVNLCPHGNVYSTLDAALTSDYVVLLLSSAYEVELREERILRSLQSMIGGGGGSGGAEVVACVQSPEDQPMTPQTRPGILKSLLSFTNYFFPSVNKVHVQPSAESTTTSSADANNLARAICEDLPAGMSIGVSSKAGAGRGKDGRAYLVAEENDTRPSSATQSTPAVWFEDEQAPGSTTGRLHVRGTVRGGRFSADRLVHIPGWGDFQIDEIKAAPTASRGRPHAKEMSIDEDSVAGASLSIPGEDADDLTALNEPDVMANEQTWPTEDEMAGHEAALAEHERTQTRQKRVKKVPKGMGAYQAAWIVDDDEDDDADVFDEEEEEDLEDLNDDDTYADPSFGRKNHDDIDEEQEETEEVELEDRRTEKYDELDDDEEERQFEEFRRQRRRENEDDMQFPDEVDTPRHIPASERFARYRGLKSFRTSPWDPYEDLPLDFAKRFQFENYEGTRRRAEEAGREEGVPIGTRVELVIRSVPRSVFEERDARLPLIVHGLLQHEHKQTVLNFAVQRNTEYEEPVRAKEPLILCVGPRRYRINPLYSQHTRGGGKGINNVHKSEKYLRHGGVFVATTYGPVIFGKQPCILLRESEDDVQVPHLVAMGSFLSADPTRIIAKRIILTGHPFKVHKKTATIRYMFFNRDDIYYFAPIELHTKYGRTGHIKEPLGTHGYFKAHFDGPIQQMDTVCMSLYKRQFPKAIEEFKPPIVESDAAPALVDNSMEIE